MTLGRGARHVPWAPAAPAVAFVTVSHLPRPSSRRPDGPVCLRSRVSLIFATNSAPATSNFTPCLGRPHAGPVRVLGRWEGRGRARGPGGAGDEGQALLQEGDRRRPIPELEGERARAPEQVTGAGAEQPPGAGATARGAGEVRCSSHEACVLGHIFGDRVAVWRPSVPRPGPLSSVSPSVPGQFSLPEEQRHGRGQHGRAHCVRSVWGDSRRWLLPAPPLARALGALAGFLASAARRTTPAPRN